MSIEHHICCSSGLDKIFSCQCDIWGSCCTDDFLSVYLDRHCSSYNLSFRNVTYNLNIKTNIALFKFIKPLAFSKGEEYIENLILTTKGCNTTGMTLELLPMLFLFAYCTNMLMKWCLIILHFAETVGTLMFSYICNVLRCTNENHQGWGPC